MVHAALHAHALLPEMQSAWQDFCQALNQRLDH
jgi:acetyl esterase